MPWYEYPESSTIHQGDVVCLDRTPGVGIRVVTATSARLGAGAPLGVALADGQAGLVPVAESGVVGRAVLGESGPRADPGARAWATVDASGRVTLTTSVTATTHILGFLDDKGDLTVCVTPARPAAGSVDLSGGLARALGQRADALEARLSGLEAELARLQARQLELLGVLAAAPSATTIAALEARVRRLETGDGGGAAAEPTPVSSVPATPAPEPQAWTAIQLSGATTSRARAPLATALRLQGTMTLELWVRPDELVDDKVILGTDHDGEGELVLSTASAQSTRLLGETRSCSLLYKFGGTGAGRQRLSAEVTCTVGTWIHVAVVRETAADDTHTVRIYKDGVSVIEQRTPAVTVASPGYRWAIGGNGSAPLAGAFADLRLWSSARTAAEIAGNRKLRLTGREPGLVGYWRLDETGMPTALAHAADATLNMEGSEVRGVAEGPGVAVVVETVPALRFDGDTKLLLGRPDVHPWRDSYTLEMWVRPSPDMGRGGFFVFQYGTDAPIASVGDDGTLYGLGRSAPGALPDDQWRHVAIVIDRSGAPRSAPTLYINGAVAASAPAPAAAATSVAPTVIGFQPWSNWGASFIGDIAEVRLWSRVLSATEIGERISRRHSPLADGLAGWWTFPADSRQVAPDLSPHANHGVVLRRPAVSVAGPSLVTASPLPALNLPMRAGTSAALRFDGAATTQLRVPDHATNRLSGDLTVEAWLRLGGDFRYASLYGKSDTAEGSLYLMADPTERCFRYYGEGNTAAGPNANFCPAELVTGEWYHVAFVRDVTRRELRYYINGALAQIDVNCKAVTGATTSGPVSLGTKILGDLAELRVWSVARDEASIRRDLGRRLTRASGLVARWAMDEGSGTVAKNSTEAGSAIDATLVGAATWITDGPTLTTSAAEAVARTSRALHMDGTTRLAALGVDSAGNPMQFGRNDAGSLTVECWLRLERILGDAPHRYGMLLSRESTYEYAVYVHQPVVAGPIHFVYQGNGTHDLTGRKVSATGAVPLNTWVHLAAVRDVERREIVLYVNGEEVLRRTGCLPMQGIGSTFVLHCRDLVGDLSAMRLWTVARSPAQIEANFQRRFAQATGLIGAWDMVDPAPTNRALNASGARISHGDLTATDSSHTPLASNPLTVVNDGPSLLDGDVVEPTAAMVTRASASPRGAVVLPTMAMVQFAACPANLGTAYTVQLWLYLDPGVTGTRSLLTLPGVHMHVTSDRLYANGSGAGGTDVLPTGTWLNVAILRDTTANEVTFLIYNASTAVSSRAVVAAGTANMPDATMTLGGLGGAVTDLRIWSGLRSESELGSSRLDMPAASRSSLLGWWPCDENIHGVLWDRIGTNHGVCVGTSATTLPSSVPLTSAGWILPGLRTEPTRDPPVTWPTFDGGGGLLIPWSSQLADGLSKSWTVELWVRSDKTYHDGARIFAVESTPQRRYGPMIGQWPTYRAFVCQSRNPSAGEIVARSDKTALPKGVWVHIAMVRELNADGTGTVLAYVNGALAETASFTWTGDPSCPPGPIRVGQLFVGAISELRIWNLARSATQIAEAMRKRAVLGTYGLIGCWPLEDREDSAHLWGNMASGAYAGATWESLAAGNTPPWTKQG